MICSYDSNKLVSAFCFLSTDDQRLKARIVAPHCSVGLHIYPILIMGQQLSCLMMFARPFGRHIEPNSSPLILTKDAACQTLPEQDQSATSFGASEPTQDLCAGPTRSPDREIQLCVRPTHRLEIESPTDCQVFARSNTSKRTPQIIHAHAFQQEHISSGRTILPSIPAEVILIITEYLPPSAVLSLGYSCRMISDKLGVSAQQVLGGRHETLAYPRESNPPRARIFDGRLSFTIPTITRPIHQSERLELLCLLDHDHMISPSKAICSGCTTTHDRSLFSSDALVQPNRERRCRGLTGRIWICPHWIFDHNLSTTSKNPQGLSHRCGDYRCEGMGVSVTVFDKCAWSLWPLIALGDKDELPQKHVVEDILRSLNLPICKHLRSSSDLVWKYYSPDCRRLQLTVDPKQPDSSRYRLQCRCRSCLLAPPRPSREQLSDAIVCGKFQALMREYELGKCQICGAMFHFTTGKSGDGLHILCIYSCREIRSFQGPTDPAWIEQLTDPADFEGLERSWCTATRPPEYNTY